MYGGMELQLHSFLISAIDGGEWLVSRSGRFISGETAVGTHWIGGWVGPRAGLEAVVKRRIPFLVLARNRTPIAQHVGSEYVAPNKIREDYYDQWTGKDAAVYYCGIFQGTIRFLGFDSRWG
jgi:hypothetical protein